MSDPRIIVALDYASAAEAQQLVARLDPARCKLKVGKELFVSAGPAFVSSLVDQGYGVFLDLKFHDIPNTVAAACRAAAKLGCGCSMCMPWVGMLCSAPRAKRWNALLQGPF